MGVEIAGGKRVADTVRMVLAAAKIEATRTIGDRPRRERLPRRARDDGVGESGGLLSRKNDGEQ